MLSTWVQSKKDEEGFTLIELLVVVIIIGILAAIAIPVFLAQRERAWRSEMQSDLRNAAVSMETYYTDNGIYDAAALTDGTFGFQASPDTTVGVTTVDPFQEYCLQAVHTKLTAETWILGSGQALEQGTC
ncbi:type IV pilin protein [Nitriliruptor alkaliphilus]|uniref:type IV pilin protein n=1 Tax=Nitriliruptor alkaliphilus TaxID=427918 RepID=UPI001B8064E0|nr:prepilin-type N-terminal cleavage/methylation domain-containing protein [Nitriliruptor alkaliphilus]